MRRHTALFFAALISALQPFSPSTFSSPPSPGKTPGVTVLVTPNPDGSLTCAPYTGKGDTFPDFSHCGYKGGNAAIPDAPVRETLAPSGDKKSDDTARIQAALDRVSELPMQPDGLRGAVLLKKGEFRCAGILEIRASGVVLRGEGDGDKGTRIIATTRKQNPLVRIGGKTAPAVIKKTAQKVLDPYVPVGARTVTVADASGFAVGQTVFLIRHGNAAWIAELGMDRIKPRPEDPESTKQWTPFDLRHDRVVTAVDGNCVTVDVGIACAIDERWGGGTLARYDDRARIENCGVEHLLAEAVFDPSVTTTRKGLGEYHSDENHATTLVQFGSVKNAWARKLTTLHFYHGPASITEPAKWITVEDCRALEPVSVLTGGRRYPYNINGQLCLVLRCASDKARHAFAFGARVPGPNVFLSCKSTNDFASSEPHHRWSTAGLYDNVVASIAIQDRQWMGTGHGWAGANYVVWNCRGTLVCQRPPTAQNFAIGFVGKKGKDAFPRPQGWWESLGTHVAPASLFAAQWRARHGVTQ